MTNHNVPILSADDPDVALIIDYLGRELTDAESHAVTARLANDPAFFAKVYPLIQVWTAPRTFRMRRQPAPAPAQETAQEPAPAPAPEPAPAPAQETTPVPAPLPARAEPLTVQSPRSPVTRWRRWALVGSLAATGAYALLQVVKGPLHDILILTSDAASGFALNDINSPEVNPGTIVSTVEAQSLDVVISPNSQVRLRPESRLTYRPDPRLTNVIVTTLGGEAVFEVRKGDRAVFVGARAGVAVLWPGGTYALHSDPVTRIMRVTVGPQGRVWLGSGMSEWISLGPGEHGEIRYSHYPQHFPGGDQFPSLP